MPGDNIQMGVELITPGGDRRGVALRHPRRRPHRRRRRRHLDHGVSTLLQLNSKARARGHEFLAARSESATGRETAR